MTTIEAICIGDELLEGRTRDANAAALGEYLASRGHALSRARFVRDDPDEIVAALRESVADVVVVGGGLGPTSDDRTRDAAAQFAQCDLVTHEPSLLHIASRFASREQDFTSNNHRQALFPQSATPLPTEVGTAPGFTLQDGRRLLMFFPGVPHEYLWFVERYIGPRFAVRAEFERTMLVFHGLGESALAATIADIVDAAEQGGQIVGFRAAYPVIELKLAGERAAVAETRAKVLERLGDWCVGEDDESLPARLGRQLVARGESVTTAESCTAGGIAALLTEVGGSSAWFERGYVTYANAAKVAEVGVLESTLAVHGAVSAQTVCQMAAGARRRADATYALAVSGIAGPGGGTPEKPVGTVHFALATNEGTFHRRVHYQRASRSKVRAGTAYTALAMLLAFLERGPASMGHAWDDHEIWAPTGIPASEET